MERVIKIGTVEVPMKATANTPRLYRDMYGKDLIVEMQSLFKHIGKNGELTGDFDFGVIERLAYTMALQSNRELGTMDDWLDQFGMDDVYGAMAQIVGLWGDSKNTTSNPKKNTEQ